MKVKPPLPHGIVLIVQNIQQLMLKYSLIQLPVFKVLQVIVVA
jgi:hypothetical protein